MNIQLLIEAANELQAEWLTGEDVARGLGAPFKFEPGDGPNADESKRMTELFRAIYATDTPLGRFLWRIVHELANKRESINSFSDAHALVGDTLISVGLDHGPNTFHDEWGESIIDEVLRVTSALRLVDAELFGTQPK
jgi:hypothetical protein